MKEGIYSLIKELCNCLGSEVHGLNDNLDEEKYISHIRSKAFEILLKNNKKSCDDQEDDPSMVLYDIVGHVYCTVKKKGNWSLEMKENLDKVTDKMEMFAKTDSSLYTVLQLLLCLADSDPPCNQEPSYGLDIKRLITDNLEHRSLLKDSFPFNSAIFDFPSSLDASSDHFPNLQTFDEIPGSGLRHQQCFAVPNLEIFSPRNGMTNMDQQDLSNANWTFPKLSTADSITNNNIKLSRVAIRQDEGYVTPDQDSQEENVNDPVDYHWEQICDEEFKPVYSWESLGSFVKKKELPFISENRAAADHVWKITNAVSVNSSLDNGKVKPTVLEEVSFGELEVAFKNLLIGVQSRLFSYDVVKKTFVLKQGVYLTGLSPQTLKEYCEDFIECGNNFLDLSLAIEEISNPCTRDFGVIYQVLCGNVTRYLQCCRGIVLQMPSLTCLLQTHNWLHKLGTQLRFLLDLVRADNMPQGGALLAHIYNQLPLVIRADLTYILYYILESCTSVYFLLLNKWIYEGECHRFPNEFFIESSSLEERDRRFWSRAFTLNKLLVPGFLKDLEGDILLCGKNMALLNICAPDDPICVAVKKGYPKVAVCLNKSHIKRIEELCTQYKQRYEANLNVGEVAMEPCRDEHYYANLRAAAIIKISEAQEAEKKLIREKKRSEFEMLKKSMEEVEARRREDKQRILEDEEKLLKEAKKVDELNKMRVEEERQKLERYYSALSETVDLRQKRLEWKMKRIQLHDKRVTFLKSMRDSECFDNNKILKNIANEFLVDYKGSGDSVESNKELDSETVLMSCSETNKLTDNSEEALKTETNISDVITIPERNIESSDEKREWLIALDVAEQARQNAAKFKERHMFSDYNLLTGEEKTYESRFGEKFVCEEQNSGKEENKLSHDSENTVSQSQSNEIKYLNDQHEKNQPDSVTEIIVQMNDEITKNLELSDEQDKASVPLDSENFIPDNSSEIKDLCDQADSVTKTNNEVEKRSTAKCYELSSDTQDKDESKPIQPVDEINDSIEKINFNDETSFIYENDLKLEEINITSIDQNLRMSVVIPLEMQLEISNQAVLRLFLVKHNLMKHLECIKKYFFLEGEFGRYLTRDLFSEIQTVVKNVQDPSYVLNVPRLNSLLRSSIGSSSDEEYTERLSFYVKKVPNVFRLIDPNMLDCLFMRYKTFWPMNIVVTDGTILKLDVVFIFLMRLHRVSWALEESIYLLKDRRLEGSDQFKKIQLFRHIMSHFVNSLKSYLASTLEGCWLQFNDEIKQVRTLDDIYDMYVKYINRVHFRCLLNKKAQPMGTHINNVFGQVLRFYEGLRKGVWTLNESGQFQHSNFRGLVHVYHSFLQEACYTYQYTKSQAQSDYQEQLVQLHSLLSLNDFYDKR